MGAVCGARTQSEVVYLWREKGEGEEGCLVRGYTGFGAMDYAGRLQGLGDGVCLEFCLPTR